MSLAAKDLKDDGERLFDARKPVLSLWQELADNFYPERAQFTTPFSLGDSFAGALTTSYPLLVRRDLGNSIGAMLRPANQVWAEMTTARPERVDRPGKIWLEHRSEVLWRVMYDGASGFVRATKEGDHDWATFGQCAISAELKPARDGILHRCWHLRDVAWREGMDGRIDTVYRRWSPAACDLAKQFKKIHPKVTAAAGKRETRWQEVRCMHIVMPSGDYDLAMPNGRERPPYVSIYLDLDNEFIMEETPLWNRMYAIPRWQTVSGSPIAYSPATVAALPDARLLQSMTLVLLEAGEKAVDPPSIAVKDAIRSDINLAAGQTTIVDAEYDERLGEALRPYPIKTDGIPMGMEMAQRVEAMIKAAFFLDRLTLPPAGEGGMSPMEVQQRVREYVRGALPLFEPMDAEYNGALCEIDFDIALRTGTFGAYEDIPQSLKGQDIQFRFRSPLRDTVERQKVAQFQETAQLMATAAQLDPGLAANVDAEAAFRDAIDAVAPAHWVRDARAVAALRQQAAQQRQAMAAMQGAQQAGAMAEQAGKAAKAMRDAA